MMFAPSTISTSPLAGPAVSTPVSTRPTLPMRRSARKLPAKLGLGFSSCRFTGFDRPLDRAEIARRPMQPPIQRPTSPTAQLLPFAPFLEVVQEVMQALRGFGLDLPMTPPARPVVGLGITLDASASETASTISIESSTSSMRNASAFDAPRVPYVSTFDGPTDTITRSGLEACAKQVARARIIAAAELYLQDPDIDEEDNCLTPTPSNISFVVSASTTPTPSNTTFEASLCTTPTAPRMPFASSPSASELAACPLPSVSRSEWRGLGIGMDIEPRLEILSRSLDANAPL